MTFVLTIIATYECNKGALTTFYCNSSIKTISIKVHLCTNCAQTNTLSLSFIFISSSSSERLSFVALMAIVVIFIPISVNKLKASTLHKYTLLLYFLLSLRSLARIFFMLLCCINLQCLFVHLNSDRFVRQHSSIVLVSERCKTKKENIEC